MPKSKKTVKLYCLRHFYVTHVLEAGTFLRYMQELSIPTYANRVYWKFPVPLTIYKKLQQTNIAAWHDQTEQI